MKRLLATILCCTLLILLACCHGDSGDGVMDRPNYTSINYKLTASQALLHFYDVSITYVDVSGREKTEMMTNEEWHFFEKTDGEHDIDFKMTVTATAKGVQPSQKDGQDAYNLYCDYSVEYYTKPTSAKRTARKALETTVKKESMEAYLQEHSTLALVNYDKNNP